MAINLYNLTTKPDQLDHFERSEEIPSVQFEKIMSNYQLSDNQMARLLNQKKHLWATDAEVAFKYSDFIQKRFPDGEAIIATNPKLAVDYARQHFSRSRTRFTAAEPAILKDPEQAAEYSFIYGKRWPIAEPIIATNSEAAWGYYLEHFDKDGGSPKRWQAAEPTIMQDGRWAADYASKVLKKRWPAAESAIASEPEAAFQYANDVIQKRWPPGEAAIMTDPDSAYQYAKYVLQSRWPEAEESIFSEPDLGKKYIALFGKNIDHTANMEKGLLRVALEDFRQAKDLVKYLRKKYKVAGEAGDYVTPKDFIEAYEFLTKKYGQPKLGSRNEDN